MTPDEMNRVGLWFGFVSGLLLIPEVVNMIPTDHLEILIGKILNALEGFSNFPQKMHPRSWQRLFSEESRIKYIEPITAILGLVASIVWVGTIVFGLIASSKFLIALGFLLPVYISFERLIQKYGFSLPLFRFLFLFVYSLVISLTIVPLFSVIRVFLLLFRLVIVKLKNLLSRNGVIRSIVTSFAVILFIASNIFQLLVVCWLSFAMN